MLQLFAPLPVDASALQYFVARLEALGVAFGMPLAVPVELQESLRALNLDQEVAVTRRGEFAVIEIGSALSDWIASLEAHYAQVSSRLTSPAPTPQEDAA